jgi:hypothetical protein
MMSWHRRGRDCGPYERHVTALSGGNGRNMEDLARDFGKNMHHLFIYISEKTIYYTFYVTASQTV